MEEKTVRNEIYHSLMKRYIFYCTNHSKHIVISEPIHVKRHKAILSNVLNPSRNSFVRKKERKKNNLNLDVISLSNVNILCLMHNVLFCCIHPQPGSSTSTALLSSYMSHNDFQHAQGKWLCVAVCCIQYG